MARFIENQGSSDARKLPAINIRLSGGAIVLLICFLLAVATRAYFLYASRESPFLRTPIVDALQHNRWALQILDSASPLSSLPQLFQASVYSVFVAFLYLVWDRTLWSVYLAQLILGGAIAVLCAGMTLKATRNLFSALVSGMAAAIAWPFVCWTGNILPQVGEMFLIAFSLFLLVRNRKGSLPALALSGFTLGLACLTRPQLVVGLVAMALTLKWTYPRRSWVPCLVFSASAFALILSWYAFSAYYARILPFQFESGFNLYLGNHPGASGMAALYPGIEYEAILNEPGKHGFCSPGSSSYYNSAALRFLFFDPGAFVGLWLKKLGLALAQCEIPAGEAQPWLVDGSFPTLRRIDFGVLLAFGLPGLMMGAFGRGRAIRMHLLFFLSGIAVLVIAAVSARYRTPVLPSLAVGVGYFAFTMRRLYLRRAWKGLTLLALAPFGLFFISKSASRLAGIEPLRNLGIALSLEARSGGSHGEQARELLSGWIAGHPDDWDAMINLARLKLEQRDLQSAERDFAVLAKAKGAEVPLLYTILAQLRAARGDFKSAQQAAAEAFRSDPCSLEDCFRFVLYGLLISPPLETLRFVGRCPLDPSRHHPSFGEAEMLASQLLRPEKIIRSEMRTALFHIEKKALILEELGDIMPEGGLAPYERPGTSRTRPPFSK